MTISEALAGFIAETEYADIPKKVIDNTKLCVLDTLSCALLGARSRWADVLKSYLTQVGGRKQAHVIGLPYVTSAANAAFANGVLSHVDDLDDLWKNGHPSVIVFPAALALAEMGRRSGKEFIAAFALGWEVACHLSMFFNPWHYRKGWHSTATIGLFGATSAASKVLKLDPERTCWALGMAACQSAGLRANFGTMTKAFHIGKVGLNGVMAAMMAKNGVNATREIFEGHGGFLGAYTDCNNREAMKTGLGDPWKMLEPGVRFKRYPCCSCTHPGIEAVLELKKAHDFTSDDIDSVKILTDPSGPDILTFDRPQDALQAKFSMPFCIALAIAYEDITPAHFTDDKVKDPALLPLMQRVTMEVEPDLAKKGYLSSRSDTTVIIKLKNGREFSCRVKIPRGNPERPFSDTEMEDKFLKCANGTISEKAAVKCIEIVRNLEDISCMTELTVLLSPSY